MQTNAIASIAAPDRSRVDTPANRAAAATRFEALFVGEMLRAMRKASLGAGLLDSGAARTWRDFQDRIVSEGIAAASPIGLAARLPASTEQAK